MINKDAIEKALLLGIVRDKNWGVLLLNNIERDYFTPANLPLYDYIKGYTDRNEYPDLTVIAYQFNIDKADMAEHLEVGDLDGLCNAIKNKYLADKVVYSLGKLNENTQELNTEPVKFVARLGEAYNELKLIGQANKSVGLFDNIEGVMTLDPTNVINSGFKELDAILTGWKRGEELIVVAGRTGQGKSWMGLKFALAAALQGETVGLYSGEMSLQQLQERILCCAKPSYTSTKEDALAFIQEKDPKIRILTQKELRRRANVNDLEEMIIRDKLTMLVIDQLSLMEDITAKPGTPLRQQYGNISTDLFSLSTKYNIPIILLVQLNRQSTQDTRGPQLENLSESDMISHNATRVILMTNINGILTFKIGKNRYGDGDKEIKYEIDYGINKYKHIKEQVQENQMIKKAKARQIFGGGSAF